MAVTACMGYGEKQIIAALLAKIETSRILLVGLRNAMKSRQGKSNMESSMSLLENRCHAQPSR